MVGALFGLVGLILGAAHFARRAGCNGLAWAGVSSSLLGLVASLVMGVVYRPFIKEAMKAAREMQSNLGGADFEKWQGVLAPDFSVTPLDGQTVKLSELKGKRVVLDFWATWCPPCLKEIPHFIQLRNEAPVAELVIVGISSEDADTLKPFVKQKSINYPVASAEDLPSPFNEVTSIPTTFFIDRQGVIQKVVVGYHDFDALKALALSPDSIGEPKPSPNAADSAAPAETTAAPSP